MNITSLRKILRSHLKEPNSTALFFPLSNSRQAANETAREYVMRLMSLRKKNLFAIKEESCSYREELIQNRFAHAVLIGLRYENIKNELRPILKLNSLSDEELLINLSLVRPD